MKRGAETVPRPPSDPEWAPARSDPLVTGDQGAWQEVVTAYQKLNASSSRVSGPMILVQGASQAHSDLVMEVVPPSRIHVTIRITTGGTQGGIEIVVVGDESRFRLLSANGEGPWQCNPIRPG